MGIHRIKCNGGEYEFDSRNQLGKGGFATVYKGKNLKNGETVAIKRIEKHLDYGEKELNQMKDLSEEDNLYTAKLVDYRNKNGELYLVLPYYEHGSLRDYIKNTKKRFNAEKASDVMKQLVECLKYLHREKNIMHRDLTAGNILIKCEDKKNDKVMVILGDFGLAKTVKDDKRKMKQTTCGTSGYMPPEVKKGRYEKDAEIYSLGGILYYMLTGREPNSGDEEAQIQDIYHIDAQAADLLRKLWEKNPLNRPKLDEIARHNFIFQKYSHLIVQNSTSKSRSKSECKHRLTGKDGRCNGCGTNVDLQSAVRKESKDSAYASSDRYTGKNTYEEVPARRIRRNSSRNPSIQSHGTNYALSLGTKSGNMAMNKETDYVKALEWPIPSIQHIFPNERRTLAQTRLKIKKGKFMIVESNFLIFEASPNGKVVNYIFEVRIKNNNQTMTVFEPYDRNQPLLEAQAEPISNKRKIKTIYSVDDLQEFESYYRLIERAVSIFHERNCIIYYGHVNGDPQLTAKLMFDRSFRFHFGSITFFQTKDSSEIKCANEDEEITSHERRLFERIREKIMIDDKFYTNLHEGNPWYPPVAQSQKTTKHS